jgi:hypothetical protein
MPLRPTLPALFASILAAPVIALAQAGAGEPLDYLGWMKDLAGACWQGIDSGGKAADRQCYEIQFGRFLRGTIEIGAIDSKPPGFRGDSLFYRDPTTGRIAIVHWASNGLVSRGEAVVEGDAIRFVQPANEGHAKIRTSWSRQGPDAFRVVRQRLERETWKDVLGVTYRRAAP